MSVLTLPRVIPAPPGRPERAGATATRARSCAVAADPSRWTDDDAREVVDAYEKLAPTWDSERGSYRSVPLLDALGRGGPWPGGPCLEIGAGTGLLTPVLRSVWPQVVGLDLSPAMLGRSTAAWRVRADAARSPIASGSLAAVALGDAPLFAPEVVRVLRSDGVVIWSNALGDAAPHHVPADVLAAALSSRGEEWHALTSVAGWGSWTVLRRP